MSCSAVRTRIGVPSASSTAAYLEKMAMPGPMMACDKSTGATGELTPPRVISSSASGSTALSSRRNSRREMVGAAGSRWRQTRTMLEARALVSILTLPVVSSVRIGQVPVSAKPALSTASRKVSQPVEAVPLSDEFRLLECIIDRDWEGRMGLLRQPVHGAGHAIHEEGFGSFLAAVTVGCGHQFFSLGYSQCGEQTREYWPQRAAQPDVEEVGEVSVADIVVVGRISRNDLLIADSSASAHHAA